MGTDKPRIDMAARLAEKAAHLELALAQAAAPERELVVAGLALVPPDRISAAPVAPVVERRIPGPVIALVQEISAAIAQAVVRKILEAAIGQAMAWV